MSNPAANNFEALFSLTNSTGGDPDERSLFNLDTLKLLLNTSATVPDILDKTEQYTHSIDLSVYTKVKDRLKLESNEQAYLLYLWMLYCKKTTFAREMNTNDQSYAVLANIGQQAMPLAINAMEIEVPLIIYSH
jgi:hypothetical protein